MVILQVIHSFGNLGAEKYGLELTNESANTNEALRCSIKRVEARKAFISFVECRLIVLSMGGG